MKTSCAIAVRPAFLVSLLMVAGVAACAENGSSGADPGDATAAQTAGTVPYVYPRVRYIEKADYAFSTAEAHAAVGRTRRGDGKIVYEIIVDESGAVKKIRCVHSSIDQTEAILHFRHELSKVPFGKGAKGYRTFFFVLNVTTSGEKF